MVLDSEKPENMETLRGFSFMPELPDLKAEMKLQYIEGAELERTWKMTRRQRLKEREQKIWDNFVKEQDVLATVCHDDPYQFLETLPETCLKELMEIELHKLKKETVVEQPKQDVQEERPEQIGDGDSPRKHNEAPQPTVTFADVVDGYDSDVIHIFDNDKEDDPSGPDDEALNDSPSSPCTVREKFDEEKESVPSPPSRPLSPDKVSNKSTENVTNMIESSIYCAKVKELRMKISEEILAIVASLECRDIVGTDPEELVKMCRRSSEFCARFNRIYMYQLHRQIHDVKRHNNASLPFARHTQFQSQMVRIVSLHHSLLQSLQIFHKSFEQTCCVRESCGVLRCVAALAREASAAAAAAPAPPHLASARDLYLDSVLVSCDKLDKTIKEYAEKIGSYMNTVLTPKTSNRSKQTRIGKGKKSMATWSKTGSNIKSVAESRLSMYSLDKQKVMHPKSCSSKDNQSSCTGTSKVRGGLGSARREMATSTKTTPHKSPRFRRPLMRDPHKGRVRRLAPQDSEIRTMVENVEAGTPSHLTPEPSPRASRSDAPRRRGANASPRNKIRATNMPLVPSDRLNLRTGSPSKGRRLSPRPSPPALAAAPSQPQLSPVSGVVCGPRETPRYRSAYESPRSVQPESPRPSPRLVDEVLKKEKEKLALEREKNKIPNVVGPSGRCEVSRIVRQLCGGDAAGNRNERVSGAKNAQLLCVNGSSPRQPSTPQLLRILEETIQKKVPKGLYQKTPSTKGAERFRMTFTSIPERAAENLFLYRTKFVQHMLASPMYANCAVGKPWEMIGSISDQIIDQLLVQCAEEMQLQDTVLQLYHAETA